MVAPFFYEQNASGLQSANKDAHAVGYTMTQECPSPFQQDERPVGPLLPDTWRTAWNFELGFSTSQVQEFFQLSSFDLNSGVIYWKQNRLRNSGIVAEPQVNLFVLQLITKFQ